MARNSEIAIIGAGPAGLATALQLVRYGIQPLLFESKRVGGLLWNANLVENYPGFPGGIPGPQLVERFLAQMRKAKIEICAEQVNNISYQGQLFQVETAHKVYPVDNVVVASGTKPTLLSELEISDEIRERIYYEVYSLLPCTGRQVAVIGAGDAAFDYALNLATENKVLILNRGETVKCAPLLWERVAAIPQISYLPQTKLCEIRRSADNKLLVLCKQAATTLTLEVDDLLCALGREAQLDFMSSMEPGEVRQLEKARKLYFAGDVKNGIFRQTAIAVGDGIIAGMKIFQHLKEIKQ